MLFQDIAYSLGHAAQRVTSIYDGYDLSGGNELSPDLQVRPVQLRHDEAHLLAPDQREQRSEEQSLEHLGPPASGHDVDSVLAERTPVVEDRMIRVRSDDQVVPLPTS